MTVPRNRAKCYIHCSFKNSSSHTFPSSNSVDDKAFESEYPSLLNAKTIAIEYKEHRYYHPTPRNLSRGNQKDAGSHPSAPTLSRPVAGSSSISLTKPPSWGLTSVPPQYPSSAGQQSRTWSTSGIERGVADEEMYDMGYDDIAEYDNIPTPAIQDQPPASYLQTGSADFNRRLSAYIKNHVTMRNSLDQVITNSYAQQYPNFSTNANTRKSRPFMTPTDRCSKQHNNMVKVPMHLRYLTKLLEACPWIFLCQVCEMIDFWIFSRPHDFTRSTLSPNTEFRYQKPMPSLSRMYVIAGLKDSVMKKISV